MYWRGTLSTRHVHESTAVDARTHSGIGNRIPRIGPDSRFFLPGIGEGIPDSRFGRKHGGNPRFPIRPGIANRGPDSPGRGSPGLGRPYFLRQKLPRKKEKCKMALGRAGTSHTTWFKRDLRPPALHTRPLLAHEGVASGPLRGPRGPRAGALPRVGREHARTARD